MPTLPPEPRHRSRKWLRPQGLEAPGSPSGPCPREGGLHGCLARVGQLELWLQEAQRSLVAAGASAMQDAVERQLLTCQEMYLEMEQKVASLAAHRQEGPGAVGSQQGAAELLASKLQLLKLNLVSFQQLLQDRRAEDGHREPQQQVRVPHPERQQASELKRSSSLQELFSLPRNKLLRQSSLQQQKELEQELSEQRGLTQAILRHGSRVRLHSQDPEDQGRLSPGSAPAEADVEEDSAQKKWDHLHSRLLALEESWLHPPSEVTDSSVRRSDGTAGCMIGAQELKELRTHISLLRELGQKAAAPLNQALDEGLFHVLYGASLSLSSICNWLHSPAGATCDGGARRRLLQSLSAELATFACELVTQGSEVSGILGSERGQQCVNDLSRVLPTVQAALTSTEERLGNTERQTAEQQRNLRELHAAVASNQATAHRIIHDFRGTLSSAEQLQAVAQMQERLQQQVEQVASLLQRAGGRGPAACLGHPATRLQTELDAALGGVRSRGEELRSSEELQQRHEQLALGLGELLTLGSERLTQEPELQSPARLRQQLGSHAKLLQVLGRRFTVLQHLAPRLPESALQKWEGEVTGLREEVARLQRRGLEKRASMQDTLQIWLQWEEDSSWSDSLLRGIDTSLPNMHGACEERMSEELLLSQELCVALEKNKARLSRTLESGLRLQKLGCRWVGASCSQLEARWRCLHKRLQHQRSSCERKSKLSSRFLHDAAALADWMGGARELIDRSRLSLSQPLGEEVDLEQRRDHYLQFVALTKELEPKTELKVTVTGAGTQLVQIREAEGDDATPVTQDPDLGLSSISSQLRHIELDWSRLLEDVPVVQEALHKRWMKALTQQGALLELQSWLRAAESQLEERCSRIRQTSSTKAELTQLLKYCKECVAEMSAHQATLDYANQPFQARGTEDGQRGRYERNRVAEDQGFLNHEWLSLQEKLRSRIQQVEQDLRNRAELEARLTQINSWITDQNLWMSSARTPSSQTELQRSISTCQNLEEKIRQKSTVLHKLRDEFCDGQERSTCDLTSQTDKSIEACAALTQQNDSLKHRLSRAQQLWDAVENMLTRWRQRTLRTSQSTEHHGGPQPSLQAQRESRCQLQLLHEEAEASAAEWADLNRAVASLREVICPDAAWLLAQQLDTQRDSWAVASSAVDQQLQKSRAVLRLWEVYAELAAPLTRRLHALQSEVASAASRRSGGGTAEQVAVAVQSVQSLLGRADTLRSDLEEVLEASKDLTAHLGAAAASLVQSESSLLSCSVLQLRHELQEDLGQLQEEQQRQQELSTVLQALERNLELWEQRLQDVAGTGEQSGLLEPSGLSADLDVLSEQSRSLAPGDAAVPRLWRLNQSWAAAAARAEEACSELQAEALRQQSFQQKCESWMSFLQRMEDGLAVGVAGSYTELRQQLRTHKRFQAEMSVAHQILHSVVTEALGLLRGGQVEDRTDLVLKLAQLRDHWRGAVQRADRRRALVEELVKHWHLYSRSLRKLHKFLSDTRALLPPAGPARRSLQQLRRSLQDLLHTELLFQRNQCSFIHTLEIGRQLFSMGDDETQAQLQKDLGALQEEWDHLHSLLDRRIDLTEAILKKWESCEAGLADGTLQLKDMKTRLNQAMPDSDDELQTAEKRNKENEDSLEDWAESLTELRTMKTDLSQYIITDDVLLLQEQVENLHCQWEELCLKVSMRKQEIADRLNAWIIFNEKNKELCEWLTQMENKVAHSSDLSIEEMVEKLKKDCMEEINLFSENKTHLKQLGEQLITASNKTKETEVNDKLKDINDRWQHLFDHIETRVKKLKETLVTVQQLDKNMSNLRTWLSRIEAELAKPVVYGVCHGEEIQKKLAEQQDLQRDIEQHAESVASVLTLCDVLLHDADACDSDSENDSIQQTTRSLDRRWRNICAMSMERRMRIEETWRLWCKFLDDYSRFEDWLKTAELTAASPDSADVLYTSAKEELKKFEAFQRQVHERLTQLELVNKQFRRLARENRTDAASKLRVMVHEGNRRWDGLQRRVAAVLRRLKHFTSQREDFEGTREALLVWLTEMDLQLTNVEHFSESDVEDKMRQLNGFQQDIMLNTNKIDALIVFGENLIQKSSPLDAVLIEDELEELHSYCQEVFGRVARFHQRLVSRRPVLEDDRMLSDLDDSPDLSGGTPWTESRKEEGVPAAGGRQPPCHLLAPPQERSGRETPVSVDSIPLEWDHTVDVGGSSHEDDEDDAFFGAVPARTSWHPQRKPGPRETTRSLSSSPTHTSSSPFHQQGYAKLMSECSGSIESVKRVKLILNDVEELDDLGLTSSTADTHTGAGVIQRWELVQAQRQKLNSDLCDLTSWLGTVLPELERLRRVSPSTSIRDVEGNIRRLKEMQKTFNSYKCLMIAVNLSSRHFLGGESAELRDANRSWTQACGGLQRWEANLQTALLQCQEFHQTLHSLLLWLARAEKQLGADPPTSRSAAAQRRETLMALQEELSSRQQQVSSLQEISSQLLLEATGEDGMEAKEKVHVIGNKLRLLLRQVAADLQATESCCTSREVDAVGSALLPHEEAATHRVAAAARQPAIRRQDSFLRRVLRAAFPLQLLFLVLLVLVCLVPLAEPDPSCTLSNNFARSFYPMLRYTNGPPPT